MLSSDDGKRWMLQQFRFLRRITGGVNGAGRVFQQANTETGGKRVLDAVVDAIISGKPGDVYIRHPAGVQPGGELGIVALAVVAESAVTVGVRIHALAENGGNALRL